MLMKQYNRLHLIGESIMKFSRELVGKNRKMVKAWGRLFEVNKRAEYITAEQVGNRELRICAFITKPVLKQAICYAKGVMHWYPSDYDIDESCLRIAYPARVKHATLKPEISVRKILPSGQCVKLSNVS